MSLDGVNKQSNCYKCEPGQGRPVPSEGPRNARIMFIGQNPGEEEAKQGRPFVGRAGKYLNQVLVKNKFNREEVYITNVVKCKTLNNRKPNMKEIRDCLPLLEAEIKEVKPRIIVLMGDVAWKTPRIGGIYYFETYHPAAAMRFGKFKAKFEDDLRKIREKYDQIIFPRDQGRN